MSTREYEELIERLGKNWVDPDDPPIKSGTYLITYAIRHKGRFSGPWIWLTEYDLEEDAEWGHHIGWDVSDIAKMSGVSQSEVEVIAWLPVPDPCPMEGC
jgi:hypothetical protein